MNAVTQHSMNVYLAVDTSRNINFYVVPCHTNVLHGTYHTIVI